MTLEHPGRRPGRHVQQRRSVSANAEAVDESAWSGLRKVAECHEPILAEIAIFLADAPIDVAVFCHMLSPLFAAQCQTFEVALWHDMYRRRWPTFSECMRCQGAKDWCALYQKTLRGHWECTLEVFEREKKVGFAMSALPARVTYDASSNVFIARYMSASEALPECIPVVDSHRLRFCPAAAQEQLKPETRASISIADAKCNLRRKHVMPAAMYPFQVLEGKKGLVGGQGVELQWKMQYCSPFGWWYGTLERLTEASDGLCQATITFDHFPSDSRWYRLTVTFGDSQIRPCSFGGYTGGVRATSAAERREWMRHFPRAMVDIR